MADLEFLDAYSGQSTEELLSLEGRYRTDSIVLAFEQALDQKAAQHGSESLSAEERTILAVEALEREVNSGGYDQFFVNSSHEYAPEIVEALERIGCTEVARLTLNAIDALGIRAPLTAEAVSRALDNDDEDLDDRLNECDDRYYGLGVDLAGALLEFIKANKDSISLS